MKTEELQGAALDWAVAKCEKIEFTYEDHPHHEMFDMHYSTDWAQGGPIIEREKIWCGPVETEFCVLPDKGWEASIPDEDGFQGWYFGFGPTPLVAAMRCYVALKLGDEIDIPEELK